MAGAVRTTLARSIARRPGPPTCVFVEGEKRRAPSRNRAVRHPAVDAGVWVVRSHFDNGGPRCALRAQADSVLERVEGGPVVVDIQQVHANISHGVQSTLVDKDPGVSAFHSILTMEYGISVRLTTK